MYIYFLFEMVSKIIDKEGVNIIMLKEYSVAGNEGKHSETNVKKEY